MYEQMRPLTRLMQNKNSMGYSSLDSQALSAPPFLLAFVVVLITAYLSDHNRSRSPYLIIHALMSSFAYFIIAGTGYFNAQIPTGLYIFIRYVCIYPATSGFFSAITLLQAWAMDNRVARESKGASIAIMNVIGQCGPLLGTRLYPASDAPWYVPGMTTCSAFMVLVAILAFVLRTILSRQNAARLSESMGVNLMNNDDHGYNANAMELEMGTYVYDREGEEGEGLMDDGQEPGRGQGHRFVTTPRQNKRAFHYIL